MLVGYFQQNLLKMLESVHDFMMTFSEEPREKRSVSGYKDLQN